MSDTTTSSRPVVSGAHPDRAGETVHFVSLGCPKNRVDSEVMVGLLQQERYRMVDDPAEADVLVVNTCSFIQPATEESIDTVLGLTHHRTKGRARKLVVTGCMVQRYGSALEAELPEVDAFLGTGEYHRIATVLRTREDAAPKTHVDVPMYLPDELAPRVPSWSPASAYLKISEGCDHRCAFCIIPTLRGTLRSRTIPSLVAEARSLAASGIVELNLVSQDSTAYGKDLGGGDVGDLLAALSQVDGLRWLRLHYAYPHGLPRNLLHQMATNPKVVRYLDIPLQHASGPMLKAMRRGVTTDGQRRILDRVRQAVPDVSLRTTFIVGFPGETDADFQLLCDFVDEQRFDHMGVFPYYAEEGTPAATLPGRVPDSVVRKRQAELMRRQKAISRRKLKALVGTVQPVLVEGASEESALVVRGRLPTQAPDVDGAVFLEEVPDDVAVGQIRPVRIKRAADYDLVGTVVA
jgi:ribosomal protein S12 methylthiotransferase